MPGHGSWVPDLLAAGCAGRGARGAGRAAPAVPVPTPGSAGHREDTPVKTESLQEAPRGSFQEELTHETHMLGTNCASLVSDASPDDGFCICYSKFIRAVKLRDRQDL